VLGRISRTIDTINLCRFFSFYIRVQADSYAPAMPPDAADHTRHINNKECHEFFILPNRLSRQITIHYKFVCLAGIIGI
jgi:hypothetical protein